MARGTWVVAAIVGAATALDGAPPIAGSLAPFRSPTARRATGASFPPA
jgi:hypothetical protein